MPNMDENAANSGDRMKHTLLLEVLSRCLKWESLVYSETHAGAGTFGAKNQTQKGRQYIAELEATIATLNDTSERVASGARYISLLKSWWSEPNHNGQYPGSVVQAAVFLKHAAKTARFCVTEACGSNHARLKTALHNFSVEPKLSLFQKSLDWLCSGEEIVMLVDPWGIVGKVTNAEEREALLNDGKVDLDTLDDILERLKVKRNAVIMLWTSFGRANRNHKAAVESHLVTWSQNNGVTGRTFHDGNSRHVYLIGVGDGHRVVSDIWPHKFICDCVREL